MKLNYFNASLRVCVDRLEHGAAGGRMYGPRLTEPLIFDDLNGLLLQTDEILDAQNFPRAYQRKRSFAPPAQQMEISGEFMNAAAVAGHKGSVCTFVISILSRQNTTWQGTVDWLDGRAAAAFTSELELLHLLDYELGKY